MSDPRIKPRVPAVNPEHPLAKGLVGAWAMQDGGGSVLRNVSGNGFDGVITDATWTSDRYGTALEFDQAVDDGVAIGSSVVSGVRTVAFTWTFPNGWGSWEPSDSYLWARADMPTNDDMYACIATMLGNMDFYRMIGAANGFFRTTQSTWAAGHPYHIVFVIDPVDGIKVYIDGVREVPNVIHNTTLAVVADSDDFYIGRRHNRGALYGVGLCSDFRLWTRAIDANEATSLYQDPWSLYRSPEPVLAGAPAAGGFFEFDQLTGGMPDLRGGMV